MKKNVELIKSVKQIKTVETSAEAEALKQEGWVYYSTIVDQSSNSGQRIILVKPEE